MPKVASQGAPSSRGGSPEEEKMIYTNGDGIWFRCTCQRHGPKLLASNKHPVVTMVEMQELIRLHGHH